MLTPTRALASSLLLASALLFALPASADVPGNPHCNADGLGCTDCSEDVGDPSTKTTYDACVSAAKAKGLVLACSDMTGTLASEYYCPKGVSVSSGSCSVGVGPGAAGGAALGLLAAVGLSALGRHRRSRR
jgi:MYXO-CTERM domain-containing protein